MKDNDEAISRYLNGEMNAEERQTFENRLSSEPELHHALTLESQIMQAAIDAGLKEEFRKAMPTKRPLSNIVKWGLLAVACIAILFILLFKSNRPGTEIPTAIKSKQNQLAFINPPLPGIDVPWVEFELDAEKGDTFIYRSGSIVCFPASSIIDAAGQKVAGRVTIRYREFKDPLDFFLAGIPMDYDSAGVNYDFESSGMCELTANKDGQAVFVNPGSRPEIHLSASNSSPNHNLYFLDTVKRAWEFIGKDAITEVTGMTNRKMPPTSAAGNITEPPSRPVKPIQADENKPAFSVEIEPGSFEELRAYNGLKFQVEDERTYSRADANEHWDQMKLDRAKEEGMYFITLTNARRTVRYKVRPVLEGANYEDAMKEFERKKKLFEIAKNDRLANEKLASDSLENLKKTWASKTKADSTWNEKINAMVRERNRQIRERKLNAKMNIQANARELSSFTIDTLADVLNRLWEASADKRATVEIMRSFPVSRFGTWNCDVPVLSPEEIPITATFKDSTGSNVQLPQVAIVYDGFNGVIKYENGNPVRVIPGRSTMIWGVLDEDFYFVAPKDFAALNIRNANGSYTFPLRRSQKKISSYAEIRKLVETL